MPDPRIAVRRATADDARAMARIHARSWLTAYRGLLPDELIANVVANESGRAERWRRRLADATASGGVLVATRDDRVVGLAFWGPSGDEDASPDTAEVQAIYLDPDAIGHGVGRELFAAVVTDVESHGYPAMTLWVLTANARARRFYEAAGWVPDGTSKVERRPGGTLHELRYHRVRGRRGR